MELNIQTAELALRSVRIQSGTWADHSRFVAEACKNIASHCKDFIFWTGIYFRVVA